MQNTFVYRENSGLILLYFSRTTRFYILKKLKSIRDIGLHFVTGLRKNRKVNRNVSLEDLDIPYEGLSIHLRGYGFITAFKFVTKNGRIDYVVTNIKEPSCHDVEKIMKIR